METDIDIKFNVTPKQKETIDARAFESGFDDISAFLKVVALKTQKFKITTTDTSTDKASIELGFKATQGQIEKIEKNMQESNCEDLTRYLKYVAMHGVVSVVIEVRSTGNLDSMLARISASRK